MMKTILEARGQNENHEVDWITLVQDTLGSNGQLSGTGQVFYYNLRAMRVQVPAPVQPSLEAFLQLQFDEVDVDRSGSLCREEFFILMRQLNLRDEHIFALLQELDDDGSGDLSVSECVHDAACIIQTLYETEVSYGDDWVHLPHPSPGNGKFWYNKRMANCRLQKPDLASIREYLAMEFISHDEGALLEYLIISHTRSSLTLVSCRR
jgi:hypothetical protein